MSNLEKHPIDVTNIPDEIKALPQWVVWQWATRDGKLTKIPINPTTKRRAAVNDSDTWASFEDAICLYHRWSQPGGIGFVFTSDDPYCGIDIDDCRDPNNGQITWAAQQIVNRIGSYAEISPSGTGIKIIAKSELQIGRAHV